MTLLSQVHGDPYGTVESISGKPDTNRPVGCLAQLRLLMKGGILGPPKSLSPMTPYLIHSD